MAQRGVLFWAFEAFGVVVVPFLVDALLLTLSQKLHWPRDDGPGLIVGPLCGAVAVWFLPIDWPTRLLMTVLYLPAMAAALFVFTFIFVCGAFGRCA